MKNELFDRIKEFTNVSGIIDRKDAEKFFSYEGLQWSEKTVPLWNSVLIAALPYNTGHEKPEYGIARYAWGIDYHKVAHEVLSPAAEYVNSSGGESFIFCDTSPVPERELAAAAGLGVIGKHGLLITEKYGSYVTLAGMLMRCGEIETRAPTEIKDCIGCGACVRMCPGKALGDDGFRAEKCISAITQKRGGLSEGEIKLLRDNKAVWGCDVCQDVCPMNRNVSLTNIEKFKNPLIMTITPDMVSSSNREFMKKYAERAFSWRGASVLRRNLEINGIK